MIKNVISITIKCWPPTSPFCSIFTTQSKMWNAATTACLYIDHECILKWLKLGATSSQKTSCRTLVCPTASFLATGDFVKLFHKFHDLSVNSQVFSNSMIFPCMELFSDFPGFPWFPERVGTLYYGTYLFKSDFFIITVSSMSASDIINKTLCPFSSKPKKSFSETRYKLSCDMWFPTMWYFDKCRHRQACAVSF